MIYMKKICDICPYCMYLRKLQMTQLLKYCNVFLLEHRFGFELCVDNYENISCLS